MTSRPQRKAPGRGFGMYTDSVFNQQEKMCFDGLIFFYQCWFTLKPISYRLINRVRSKIAQGKLVASLLSGWKKCDSY